MRYLTLIALFFIAFAACEVPPSNTNQQNTAQDSTETTQEINSNQKATSLEKVTSNCRKDANILEGNVRIDNSNNREVLILADESTTDAQLGASHRILEIYSSSDCAQLDRQVLPVNSSPDIPYYLSDLIYNQGNQLLGIRGAYEILCYDFNTQKLSAGLRPKFLNERFAEDAQSGRILHLETWERFLIGYAQDQGAFVYDLSNENQPKSILPTLEYSKTEGRYHSLFLLPSGTGDNRQILVPYFDYDKGVLQINPMLDKPRKLALQTSSDQRFLIASHDGGKTGVDLEQQKATSIPAEQQNQSPEEIFQWLKNQ